MCLFGEFTLGTLYEYRNKERYGSKDVDEGEGKLRHTQHIRESTLADVTQYSKHAIRAPAAETMVTLEGVTTIASVVELVAAARVGF